MITKFHDGEDLAKRIDRMYRCDPNQVTPRLIQDMLRQAEVEWLRANFAASAMQGLMSRPPTLGEDRHIASVVDKSFKAADAMLAKMEHYPKGVDV